MEAKPPFNVYYQATASDDVVVKDSEGYLEGIIIGADVGSAEIEISDNATTGDANIKVYLASDTLLADTGGYVPVRAKFENGITADLTNQTNVTFIYK